MLRLFELRDRGVPMIGSENKNNLGANRRFIYRLSVNAVFARKVLLFLPAIWALSGFQGADANQCFTDGPRYRLESDTVEWRMKIRSSENCLRGVRFSYVYNATVSLVTPPKFGQVVLVGPGFSYTAKSDFQGEDSFIVGVSGSKNKTSGFSTIRVVVSVVGAYEVMPHSYAHFEAN